MFNIGLSDEAEVAQSVFNSITEILLFGGMITRLKILTSGIGHATRYRLGLLDQVLKNIRHLLRSDENGRMMQEDNKIAGTVLTFCCVKIVVIRYSISFAPLMIRLYS